MRICYKSIVSITTIMILAFPFNALAQQFIHPGIDQSLNDLEYMRSKVVKGEQPWKGGFDRLKAATDTGFVPRPHTHVLRGPYGKPNIGGDDLSKSANMAYN